MDDVKEKCEVDLTLEYVDDEWDMGGAHPQIKYYIFKPWSNPHHANGIVTI